MGRIKVKAEKQGMTNSKKREEAIDRIGNLEQGLAKLVETINNSFKQITQDNTNISSSIHDFYLVMQAMMEVLGGTDTKFAFSVREALQRLKIAELEGKAEKQLAELKIMETEGKVIKVLSIDSDNDFVISSQKGEDGSQKYPTKAVGIVGMFIPAVKELLMGKKPSETLTLPTGGTLEILEVYRLVEKLDEVQPVENAEQEYDLEATAGQSDDSAPKSDD
jgi:hypothetical protein